jgi:hypothetical protein
MLVYKSFNQYKHDCQEWRKLHKGKAIPVQAVEALRVARG